MKASISNNTPDLLETLLDDDCGGNDAAYVLETMQLKQAILELVKFKVVPGDGDILTKARWVLETGAKHIVDGRPSKEFLNFVAYSIQKTLSNEEASLDSAFRLANPPKRPKKDPYSDKAIIAYQKAMGEYVATIRESEITLEESRKATRIAVRKAIEQAYQAKWGATPQAHQKNGIDIEIIKGRKRSIQNTLRNLGHY